MKLTTRITASIGIAATVLFGLGGAHLLATEASELRTVAEKESILLGRTLQTAIENALRDRQLEDVKETVQALATIDPAVGIFMIEAGGTLVGVSPGARASAGTLEMARNAVGEVRPLISFEEGEPGLLRLGLALREEQGARAASALVLEKPLWELERDLAATRRGVGATVALFILAATALTWLLTRRYVGQPVGELVADMERVRSGDLSSSVLRLRADELDAARSAFDALVTDLRAAHDRADLESEARRRLERALQNADKLITLGQLSAVVAHEIGSPLQVLEGRARWVRKHAAEQEKVRSAAETIVEQARRITRLVEQMLSITRRRPAARVEFDGENAVRAVLELLELEADRGRVRLTLRRDGATRVYADPDRLQQVVLNLVRNAMQASPPESIVTVTMGGDADWFTLDVEDQGGGVAPEVLPHLFEPFYTTRTMQGGSGLGLSVVHSIVQEHGGTVRFEETGPNGSRVRVRLPRTPEVHT
ncbi:sensor histidine kinase [Vulgatibacter sp.]|uniref:sensor histidine kinase n=1 Tax=Vulgatibacter sp. TaxID=1971226 RepID=UPI003564838E